MSNESKRIKGGQQPHVVINVRVPKEHHRAVRSALEALVCVVDVEFGADGDELCLGGRLARGKTGAELLAALTKLSANNGLLHWRRIRLTFWWPTNLAVCADYQLHEGQVARVVS